jgi:hypothetical protein
MPIPLEPHVLRAITLNRYRAFKGAERIQLAPITLIIGKNGSGKSIISRLPLLLAKGISENPEGPIDLTAGGVEHAASFLDLVNERSAYPFSLGLEVQEGVSTASFETTLRYVIETRALAIEKFVLHQFNGSVLTIEISAAEQLASEHPTYSLKLMDEVSPTDRPIFFDGLLPNIASLPDSMQEETAEVFSAFRTSLSSPSYLGPFREEPPRLLRMPNRNIRDLGPRGERALEVLADDRLRGSGMVATAVHDWFTREMGQGIDVDVTGENPQVQVGIPGSKFFVSLADTGAGYSQSLPVVVQHFGYRAGRLKGPVLIVEQPELHLHPAAHGAIADLVIGSCTVGHAWSPALAIVETHSEEFIMRIRRRIVEGLSPGGVTLLSLQHRESSEPGVPIEPIKVIAFDVDGNPDAWPVGVFEEAFDDLAQMRMVQRSHRR